MRVIAVEPETSTALHSGDRRRRAGAGHADVDRRRPERAVRRPARDRDRAGTSSACSSPRRRSRMRSASSTSARSSRASRPARRRPRRCSRARSRPSGPVRPRLRRQRRRPNRLCYPGPAMKADIHPEYVFATVHCSLREHVRDAFHEARAARRDLLATATRSTRASRSSSTRAVASSASSAGSRRPSARERASALAHHGIKHRRPGRPRGRDDARTAQLGGRRAQARRRDRARRDARSTRSMARHWALRLPIVRGVVALGESPRDRLPRALASRRTTPRRRRRRATTSRPRSAAGRSSSRSPSRSASR